MNRLSFLFIALMAATFAVQTPKAGETLSPEEQTKKAAITPPRGEILTPEGLIRAFTAKVVSEPGKQALKAESSPSQKDLEKISILFATVPHPLETHLSAAFDHDVDALQDGLQDAGYLFDSSLIPWTEHPSRESFTDDAEEKKAKSAEDAQPGVLLFRKAGANLDAYTSGLVVFLIAEKPTEGIAYEQVQQALNIIQSTQLTLQEPVRIVGPTFSGSFASFVPVVRMIAERLSQSTHDKLPMKFIVRSGGVTVGRYAVTAANALNGIAEVDFGSAKSEGENAIAAAMETLGKLGIPDRFIAILSESESAYGAPGPRYVQTPIWKAWQVAFPRDVSSLRTEYQKQGILDAYAPEEPWKRSLNLKTEENNEGDTVRMFGGSATNAAQESILLGISDFLRSHAIRAVIISATNEQDRYFLAQFFHAHNLGVRVVVNGATRLFMRGPTAQFRGDLMVDNFPMLPRLRDWTGGVDDKGNPTSAFERTFADESAQGTYFATLDLELTPHAPVNPITGQEDANEKLTYPWVTKYSKPNWGTEGANALSPAMYVVALGGNSAWPVAAPDEYRWEKPYGCRQNGAASCVEMPFTLFARDKDHAVQAPPEPAGMNAGSAWRLLFCVLIFLGVIYVLAFWFANPVSRVTFASFAPMESWRYWLCKVVLPCFVAAAAFRITAWAVGLPKATSAEVNLWWWGAQIAVVIVPLVIVASAILNARKANALPKCILIPAIAAFAGILILLLGAARPNAGITETLNIYREMHWESGLSLLPTGLLLLLALFVWSYQAGQGVALCECAPPLPNFPHNDEISYPRSKDIVEQGRPFPSTGGLNWIWLEWAGGTTLGAVLLIGYHPFKWITSLEPEFDTKLVLWGCLVVASLTFLDVLQFGWLWSRLRTMLRALARQKFKRSFVPIQQFDWRAIWSFRGVAFNDRRVTEAAQVDCILELAYNQGFGAFVETADALREFREKYNRVPLQITLTEHRRDRQTFCELITRAGTEAARLLELAASYPEAQPLAPPRAVVCQCKETEGRFSGEREEVDALPEWRQTAERLLCLLYIGLVQFVVARLHTLLMSVAAMFSLVALAVAIYPFAPVAPLVAAGLVLLGLIGFAFFKVFSGMDTDPVLARIVNGDDRKLQWSFYGKFAESMALPLLTLASTLLPGGASRLLDLARALFSHGQ